jgi:hypothetical protein
MHILYEIEWDDKVIKYGDGIGIWKEVVVFYFGVLVLSLDLSGENQENIIMIASNPVKICMSYPWNAWL